MPTLERMAPLDAGRRFIYRHFPDCLAAFVAGSPLRGEETETSDLDMVIVTMREDAPYRTAYVEFGWPIEAFVHTPQSYAWYFATDVARRVPSLLDMCATGEVLRDRDGLAERIKAEALSMLEMGPPPMSEDEITALRYCLTDCLDDLVGCTDRAEGVMIAHDVADAASRLVLTLNGKWLGNGKWIIRALKRHRPELALQLSEALERYARQGDTLPLVRFATEALDPVGGRLFEGYYSRGMHEAPHSP